MALTELEKTASPLSGLRILVVEDEIMVAMMLEEMLEGLGCEVVTLAPNIEKALVAIRQQVFDGVLLDVNIHGQKTTVVAEELVSRALPFLLVTGYSCGDSDPPVMKCAPRLQKPFDEVTLANRMEGLFVIR